MMVSEIPIANWVAKRFPTHSLIWVGMGWLSIFFLLPMVMLVETSLNFADGKLLGNYTTALSDVYISTIIQSFIFGMITTVATLILGFVLCYYIVFASRHKMFLLGLVILPFWVAYIVRYLGIQLFFLPTGPFSQLFGSDFGILFSSKGVILGLITALLPFAVLPIYNSIESIDEEMVSASYMLGANKYRTLVSVIIPLSISGIMAAGVIVFILASGSFLAPALLGGPGDNMIANLIADTFRSSFNIELASAISVLYTALMLLLLSLFNRFVDIGEVLGEI